MKRFRFISGILFVVAVAAGVALSINACPPAAFIVAPTGNDSNAGTVSAPFATLTKCQTAMRGSGVKTCYIRAGSYSPAGIGGCYVGATNITLEITTADAGETFANYPSDAYNSAIFDYGGSAGTTNGHDLAICVDAGISSPVTFSGLTFQNVWSEFFYTQSAITLTNNKFIGQYREQFPQDHAAVLLNDGAGSIISHNYFTNIADRAVDIEQISNGGLNNVTIDHNSMVDTCHIGGDCGAIYITDSSHTTSTGVVIAWNYIRGINLTHAQPGSGNNVGFGIYLDGPTTSGKTVHGNVVTGAIGFPSPSGGGGQSCFFIHTGSNDTFAGNICDLGPNTFMENFNAAGGTSNAINTSIFVANQAQTAGTGWNGVSGGCSPSNNAYYNYNTSFGISNSSNACGSDPSPHALSSPGPMLRCYGAMIGPTSPVFAAPISFPALPSGWDTAGFWGPPGWTVPQAITGNNPSWPVTSGDGVTCSGAN
jgi:hypothetical protein